MSTTSTEVHPPSPEPELRKRVRFTQAIRKSEGSRKSSFPSSDHQSTADRMLTSCPGLLKAGPIRAVRGRVAVTPRARPCYAGVRKNRKMQQSILTGCNFFRGTSGQERKALGSLSKAATWTKDDDKDFTILLESFHHSRFEDRGDVARCVTAFELGVMYDLGGLRDLAVSGLDGCCDDFDGEDGDDEIVAVVGLVWGGDLMGKGCDEKVRAVRRRLLADGHVRSLSKEQLDKLGKKVSGFLADLMIAMR